MTSASPCFQTLQPASGAALRLFCFPSAGSGASAYRAWLKSLSAGIELVAVQPPGREGRGRESAPRRLSEWLDALEAQIPESEVPFAFFGHSLGGIVAFELARRLEGQGRPSPCRVLIAASIEPGTMSELDRRCHQLSDPDFEAYAATFGAFPEDLRRYPRQFKAVMDLLRADLEVFATQDPSPEPRLRAPLTVFGARDDGAVAAANLEAWRSRTSGAVNLEWHDGGHFFPFERAAAVVPRVVALFEPVAVS